MPLLKKEPFVKSRPPQHLKPTTEVFHCKLTNEIFIDYEQFFERIILCNSLVWTCALTGRPGLTYQEALESEQKARKRLASFPDYLQKPILFLASLTRRSRLNDLNDDVFNYAKERFFFGEVVEVILDGAKRNCRVLGVITGGEPQPAEDSSDDDVICLDDPVPAPKSPTKPSAPIAVLVGDYMYIVQNVKTGEKHTVKANLIGRKKGLYTREKSKLYLKQHCDLGLDGLWKVKAKFLKKFNFADAKFSMFFGGAAPKFPVSIAKKKPKVKSPKGSVIDLTDEVVKKKRGRKKKEEKEKMMAEAVKDQSCILTPEQRAELREKLRLEKIAAKEQEKARKKEEREENREKKKEEKRLREEYLKEWSRHRDDLECDDLKDLPVTEPVCGLSPDLFGDIVMVMEYLHCFDKLFDVQAQFAEKITLQSLNKALSGTEINGLYFDVVKFLLMAIFNLQEEEDEEEEEFTQQKKSDIGDNPEMSKASSSMRELVKEANHAVRYAQMHYSTSLSRLQLDAFTLTEILRLHLTSAGCTSSNNALRFRYQNRGGYSSLDDPGLELRLKSPEICDALSSKAVFDLPAGHKLQILVTLINQLLTFMGCREFLEENFEKLRELRSELRQHRAKELTREKDEAAFWYRKRVDERRKEAEAEAERKASKKKAREDRLRIEEMRKEARAAGKDLGDFLRDGGHDDLVARLEADMKEAAEKLKEQQQQQEQGSPKSEATAVDQAPTRASSRQKHKKDEELVDVELPTENVDWEKLTPEERVRWKEATEKKEQEIIRQIIEVAHGNAIIPLGRDRTFRRYWAFQSLPGLFVEDHEMHVDADILTPIAQTGQPDAGKSVDTKAEEPLNTSDKENNGAATNCSDEKPTVETGSNGPVDTSDRPASEDKAILTLSVHEQCKTHGKVQWSYFTTSEQIEYLISSLNPRGHRESALRSVLLEQKRQLLDEVAKCPLSMLRAEEQPGAEKSKSSSKSKKLPQSGAVCNSSAQELLELNLREGLLDMEDRIYAGSLGCIKVEKRAKWREAIEDGGYDPQDEELAVPLDNVKPAENSTDKPQEENMEVDGEESNEKQEMTHTVVARDLSKALLQICKGLDPKFLGLPLGEDDQTKKEKQQKALEAAFRGLQESPFKTPKKDKSQKKEGDDSSSESEDEEGEETPDLKSALERWEESLLSCTSLAQIFTHLTILERSIIWSKSALNAKCHLCRRKGDAEKMLLCDGCDRGHHMYCLKPQVKKIPAGDWYCPNCRPKDIMRTPRKVRRQSTLRESAEEDEGEKEEVESSDDDSDAEDSDDSDDSDDEDSDDSDEAESDDESEEEEEEPTPAKVLIGKAKGKKKAVVSGRSTPASVTSGRSSRNQTRESTPVDGGRSRARQKLNMDAKASGSKDTRDKSSGRSRQASETQAKSKAKSNTRSRHSIGGTVPQKKQVNGHQRSRSQGAETSRKRKAEEVEEPASKSSATKARGGEKAQQMKQCEELVKELMAHEEAWPFLQPVSKKDAPDYHLIIKNPMDLSTIKIAINKAKYEDPAAILEDIRLVFTNCERYNVNTAEEYQSGQLLCRYFVKRVKEMKLDLVLARRAQEQQQQQQKDTTVENGKPAKRSKRST